MVAEVGINLSMLEDVTVKDTALFSKLIAYVIVTLRHALEGWGRIHHTKVSERIS